MKPPNIDIKKEYNNTSNTSVVYNINNNMSIVDPRWEFIDPTPNIHTLFLEFNKKFFWNKLLNCQVRWSSRMTLCAGVCSYKRGFCSIGLSKPLLRLRPRKDLIQTLLHEMIHAYLFVTHNHRNREDHGYEFRKHMYRINKESGAEITIYHPYNNEVEFYKQHWWKCNGSCKKLVKKSINRPPKPDATHQLTCGGIFIKIKEPDNAKSKSPNVPQREKNKVCCKSKHGVRDDGPKESKTVAVKKENSFPPLLRPEYLNSDLNILLSRVKREQPESTAESKVATKSKPNILLSRVKREQPQSTAKSKVTTDCECPLCNKPVKISLINEHLDVCLGTTTTESTSTSLNEEDCIQLINLPSTSSNFNLSLMADCPICNKPVLCKEINSHLDTMH